MKTLGKQTLFDVLKVFNGRADCSDWSDECPTSTGAQSDNILSSRYELIGNPFLRALVWIMGIPAVVGNLVRFYASKAFKARNLK